MDKVTNDSPRTLGPILQEARTAKGLTIEAAAAASKVPLAFVRLMEQEQFHLLPDPVYLARFLKEYATFLGLDPKSVEAQLKGQISSPAPGELPQTMPSIDSRIDFRRLAPYLLPLAVVIPLFFIGLSLLSGRQSALPPVNQPESPESQSPSAPLPEVVPAVPPASQVSPPPTYPIPAPTVQEPQYPPARYRLKAEAKEATWLAVSADGAPRKEALLRPGETAQWSANTGFAVTIGNSRGVVLSLNGRPILLKGEPGQVIRDLALPEDGGSPHAGAGQ